MNRNFKLTLRSLLGLGVLGALLMSMPSASSAADLSVIAPSNVTVGVNIGLFVDDEGSPSNPNTGAPYGPGDINPDTGNPVTFTTIASAVGQADPSVPVVRLPGGVVPVLSTGLSTTLGGTVQVNPNTPGGGIAIDSSAVTLAVSGLWQPGTVAPTTAAGPPAPSELGAYIDASSVVANEYVIATLNNVGVSFKTGAVPLTGGLGNMFDDPNGQVTLTTADINGFAAGPLASTLSTTVNNVVTSAELGGTYDLVGNVATVTLPFHSSTFASLGSDLAGLYAEIIQDGTLYATGIVPEPSSVILMSGALACVAYCGVRRRRKAS